MPWASRTTCTSPERPGSSSEPVVCGSGRRTSTVTTTVATTRSSTRAAARYVVTRAARGQPRKVRHQSPGPERGADEGAEAGEPGWSLMVSVIVPCRMIGSRRGRVPARSAWQLPTRGPRPTDATEENRADLPVRLHRVRPRLRTVPELLRRRPDGLPRVRRAAAQGVQRRRRRLQGLRLLPERQPVLGTLLRVDRLLGLLELLLRRLLLRLLEPGHADPQQAGREQAGRRRGHQGLTPPLWRAGSRRREISYGRG